MSTDTDDTDNGGDEEALSQDPTKRTDGRAYTPLTEYETNTSAEGSDTLIHTATQLFADFFYPAYAYFLGDSQFIRNYEAKLREANIRTTADMFISGALGFGAILGSFIGVLLSGLFYLALRGGQEQALISLPQYRENYLPFLPIWIAETLSPLKIPVALLIVALVGALIGIALGALFVLPYPYMRSSGRDREISILLPDVVSFMYSLSIGGMNQLEVFEAVANAEDVYGETSVEFQRIVQETKYFGVDYQTSIENVANSTPSDDLRKFLTDTLSIINSGGSMATHLAEQKNYYMDEVQRQQEDELESLEFFGEMYMTLSIVPMILLIIYLVMGLMSGTPTMLFIVTVYGGIPFINLMFILLVSTINADEPGDGKLHLNKDGKDSVYDSTNLLSVGVVKDYTNRAPVFKSIKNEERKYRISSILKKPQKYFIINPSHILAFTIPATIAFYAAMITTNSLVLDWGYHQEHYVWQTFLGFYAPMFMNMVPYAIFYEWNVRSRQGIMKTLTEDLRKLANTNETGQPLLESMRVTARDSDSILGNEFMKMYKKVEYGRSLKPALIEFNNDYRIPRLARTVKLVTKAQEASSQITDVLKTAAQGSEVQDQIAKERKSRTRMQVAVIGITFLIFLAVMAILKVMFIDSIISELGGSSGNAPSGGAGFDPSQLKPMFLSTMYFHAITLQALWAGFISGYMQKAQLPSGTKYAIVYLLISLTVWVLFV